MAAQEAKQPNLKSAESMAQAAAVLGLTKAHLSWAKGEGCQAFRGPRVYLAEFRDWWRENVHRMSDETDLPSKDVLDRKLKLQRLERERREAEREDGKWIRKTEVISAIAAIAAEQNAALHALPRELTPKLLGLDAVAISEVMQATVCRVIGIFQHGAAKYHTEPPWTWEI